LLFRILRQKHQNHLRKKLVSEPEHMIILLKIKSGQNRGRFFSKRHLFMIWSKVKRVVIRHGTRGDYITNVIDYDYLPHARLRMNKITM